MSHSTEAHSVSKSRFLHRSEQAAATRKRLEEAAKAKDEADREAAAARSQVRRTSVCIFIKVIGTRKTKCTPAPAGWQLERWHVMYFHGACLSGPGCRSLV